MHCELLIKKAITKYYNHNNCIILTDIQMNKIKHIWHHLVMTTNKIQEHSERLTVVSYTWVILKVYDNWINFWHWC